MCWRILNGNSNPWLPWSDHQKRCGTLLHPSWYGTFRKIGGRGGEILKAHETKWYLKHALYWLAISIIAAIVAITSSCCIEDVKHALLIRKDILVQTETHYVTDRSLFNWERARKPETGIAGYAYYRDGICHIWILAYEELGLVYPIYWWVLGHEFQHCHNWVNPTIINPDKYEWWMKR
jgi:hypothetical protein